MNPPGCTDEASSIGAEGYMPLSQVARAFLKMTYPESTVVWELLHCDDLQCTRHQQAYVELHRHLTGMQVGPAACGVDRFCVVLAGMSTATKLDSPRPDVHGQSDAAQLEAACCAVNRTSASRHAAL